MLKRLPKDLIANATTPAFSGSSTTLTSNALWIKSTSPALWAHVSPGKDSKSSVSGTHLYLLNH